jgi:putative ABC transport system permease protein
MFFLTYLRRELRGRLRQAVFVALGLAVGVGLVVTVGAVSAGVRQAQTRVLHSLYGIGTSITVTNPPSAPSQGGGGAARGRSLLLPSQGLGIMYAAAVPSIAGLHGVSEVAGGLTLTDTQLTGQPVPTSFSVTGVDLTHPGLGPYGSGSAGAGRALTASDASSDVAVVDSGYATAENIHLGSTIMVGARRCTVVGLVRQPQGGGSSDVYVPLATAQSAAHGKNLDNLKGRVDVIYVRAAGGSAISAVRDEISKRLPGVTVTTSQSLADAVRGSLSDVSGLAGDLGRWLDVASLVAAFAVASLLTLAAVTRRVGELGTLKALGWRSRRIVAQIVGESLVCGVVGAVAGTALGYAGAALVGLVAPELSAGVAAAPGSSASSAVTVHLTAPVSASAALPAGLLAIAAGLLAGCVGGWRAARMPPARALGRIA